MISEIALMLLTASLINGIGRVKLLDILEFIKRNSVTTPELLDALKETLKTRKNIDLSNYTFNKSLDNAKEIIEKSENFGIKVLCCEDKSFPQLLKSSIFNPAILYVKGNPDKVPSHCVSVIGTREPTEIGRKYARRISKYLAENNISVVSGLALGCDTCAHEGALEGNGHTIAVLAHGLDMVAPPQNSVLAQRILDGDGLLVSTYPIGTKPTTYTFAQRDEIQAGLDEIQAGLSEKVVLIQSGLKGGSLIASRSSLEDNRKLVVVAPHSDDKNNNEEKIQANLSIIEAKEQNSDDSLEIFKSDKLKDKNVLSNIQILHNKYEYNSIFHISNDNENTIANKPIVAPDIHNGTALEPIKVPGFEVYMHKKLNGVYVDYILLNKDKGAVFINICHEKQSNISNEYQTDHCVQKLSDLESARDNLYLPLKATKRLSLVLVAYSLSDKVKQLKNDVITEIISDKEPFEIQINRIISNLNLSEDKNNSTLAYQKVKSYLLFSSDKGDFFFKLSADQKEIINNDTIRRRRISGSAGSGKTLLVAIKAARLILQGKSVLVTSYNITIMNYVRNLINKGLSHPEKLGLNGSQVKFQDKYSENLETVHYHGKLKMLMTRFNVQGRVIDAETTEKVTKKIKECHTSSELQTLKYDAVIIDEGQDFLSPWLKLLSLLVKDDGFLFIFADATQDLYFHSGSLKENETKNLGFKGPWKKLAVSYRLPQNIAILCKDFAQNFINVDPEISDVSVLPQYNTAERQTDFSETKIDCFQFNLIANQIDESHDRIIILKIKNVLSSLLYNDGVSLEEMTLLCTDKIFGRKIVEALNKDNISTESVFSNDYKINKEEKLSMGSTPEYLKCSTVHSFKGWEANTIILVNVYGRQNNTKDPKPIRKQDRNCFYVALTRLSQSTMGSRLIIINEFKEYEEFLKNELKTKQLGNYYDLALCQHTAKSKVILYDEK